MFMPLTGHWLLPVEDNLAILVLDNEIADGTAVELCGAPQLTAVAMRRLPCGERVIMLNGEGFRFVPAEVAAGNRIVDGECVLGHGIAPLFSFIISRAPKKSISFFWNI